MALHENTDWHNANGGGLAFRPPPTVDEAAMYSPFTSIIPFSADVIPFPSAEPPTPPSTLTSDQQNAAKRAVGILNDEIKGQSTAQHLNDTLQQLQRLLRREKLPEYNFKPMPQLATPPPDSPVKDTNGRTTSHVPALSPFASMLLRHTDVSFTALGDTPPERSRQLVTPAQQSAPSPQVRPTPQPPIATPNGTAYAQNGQLPFPSSAASPVPSSTPTRPGPAVMIKPVSVRREEYTKYDSINTTQSLSQEIQEQQHSAGATSVLKPHEREIADRKTEELRSFVATLSEDKDCLDASDHFMTVSTPHGDFAVMKPRSMDTLSDRIANLINLGRFAALPVDLVMDAQSLLEPGIASVTKIASISLDEAAEWSQSVHAAMAALKASKLMLDTMIEGRDDHRVRREEIIDIMIDLIKFIKDECIFPIVQARRSGSKEELFSAATGQKKELQAVLRLCGSVISQFALLIGKYNLTDRALNGLEYFALEFVMEQNSDSEKDSVFTIQKFEHVRQKAVDVLAEIFAQHEEQQNSILQGILSNLEKLPDKKASARHFKSVREVPIMTISALFMRFVQAAATNKETLSKKAVSRIEEASEDEESDYEPGTATAKPRNRTDRPGQNAEDLFKKASVIAMRIVASLVDRASNVSKTGDKPFRNLLDLFIEDFCNVLGSPEWPAADMLLQQLVIRMTYILQAEPSAKQKLVDKDMALSALSRIGCGILDLKLRLKKLKREKLDVSQSDISSKLDRYIDEVMSDDMKEGINELDLYAFDGPYRMVVESLPEYLELPLSRDDARLRSVSGYHITSWLAAVTRVFPVRADDGDAYPPTVNDMRKRLASMFVDPAWLAQKYKFQPVSDVQSKIAAGIITLQNPLCRYLTHIVTKMLEKMRDKTSSKLRSRGMTGLEQLIQKDPRVVTQGNVHSMVACFADTSPMVRESTLSLVATCLEHQPSLLPNFFMHIIRLANDVSNGPKKKAIKLLREIYQGPSSADYKLKIIISLLPASQDDEKTVYELARSVLEEILLSATKTTARLDDSQLKLDRTKRSKLIIDTTHAIHGDPNRLEAFEKFFAYVLSRDARADNTNIDICKDFVADMIDEVISPTSESTTPTQARILTALSMFAKVRPTLFTFDQVQLLKLYIKVVGTADDLDLVKPTAVIFRYVFPTLKSLQSEFAEEVRASLMTSVPKLANWAVRYDTIRATLLDVAHCLWIVCPKVSQGMPRLIATISSILCQLRPLVSCPKPEDMKKRVRLESYLILLGTFGQVCNFDQYRDEFRARLKMQVSNQIAKDPSVAQQLEIFSKADSDPSLVLLETVRPFTSQAWDMEIRIQALRSVGAICRGTPILFTRAEIAKVYKLVFVNGNNDALRAVALDTFEAYCTFAERRSETGAEIAVGQGAVTGNARLDSSYAANDNDHASDHIVQTFFEDFKEIALGNKNDLAAPAIRIIASGSRQGILTPQKCAGFLIASSTSSDEAVAQTATTELRRLSESKQSYIENEYVQAVRMTFDYQTSVSGDSHGMREATYSPKLVSLFETLKTARKPVFRQFVVNICKLADFDLLKLDASGNMPDSVLFTRFCLENLALIDFPLLEDVAKCLDTLEAIVFKNTGPLVAVTIETEMPKRSVTVQQPPVSSEIQQQMQDAAGHEVSISASQLEQTDISDARLRLITTACMILKMVWETRAFVRRCYNLQKLRGAVPQQDYAKPAQRNNLVTGKDLWESLMPIMNALHDRESMLKTCYDFAEILEIDLEAQLGKDEDGYDDNIGAGYETPTEGDATVPFPTSGRGRKRKSNVSLGNTPKKARGRPAVAKNKTKRNSKTPDVDDDSD